MCHSQKQNMDLNWYFFFSCNILEELQKTYWYQLPWLPQKQQLLTWVVCWKECKIPIHFQDLQQSFLHYLNQQKIQFHWHWIKKCTLKLTNSQALIKNCGLIVGSRFRWVPNASKYDLLANQFWYRCFCRKLVASHDKFPGKRQAIGF